MAIRPSKKIEFEPDAWERFERFIGDIARAGPQHRKPTEKTNRKVRAQHKHRKPD